MFAKYIRILNATIIERPIQNPHYTSQSKNYSGKYKGHDEHEQPNRFSKDCP